MNFKLNKKVLIISLIITFLLASIGFTYFYINNSIQDNLLKETNEKQNSTNEKKYDNSFEKEKDISYKLNIDWDFLYTKDWNIENDVKMDLKNMYIWSIDNWLKQRIKLDSLNLSYLNQEKKEDNFYLENLDLISDNEKVYFYSSWSLENDFLNDLFSESLFEKIKKLSKQNKYTMIDNSNPILDFVWDLQKDENIKEIIKAFSTSSPKDYLKLNWYYQKFIDIFSSDKILDKLFSPSDKNNLASSWDIENLEFNQDSCFYITPFFKNLLSDLDDSSRNMIRLLMSGFDFTDKESCESSIENLNKLSWEDLKIYKKWDIKNGNYSFVLEFWKSFSFEITYSSHKLDFWNIIISSDVNNFYINIKWDLENILDSEIRLNTNLAFFIIEWSLKNGNWKFILKFTSDIENESSFIEFENYKIVRYNLSSKKSDYSSFEISWKWNTSSGSILFDNTDSVFEFNYDEDMFYMKYEKSDDLVDIWFPNFEISYKNSQINWYLDNYYDKIGFNWTYNSFDDFDITLVNLEEQNSELKINASRESNWELKYSIYMKKDWSDSLDWYLTIKVDENDKNKDFKIVLGINDILSNKKYNLNLNIKIEEVSLDYSLPDNFEEIDIEIKDIFVLPKFSEFKDLQKSYKILWYTSFFASAYSYYIFSNAVLDTDSDLGYSENSFTYKTSINFDTDASIYKVSYFLDTLDFSKIDYYNLLIPIEDKMLTKNTYIWWKELEYSKDFFVWTLNYDMFWLNRDEYLDKYWDDLIIWLSLVNWAKTQVLSKKAFFNNESFSYYNNYSPRIVENISLKDKNWKIAYLYQKDVWKIEKWDYTNLWKVVLVSDNWTKLYLNKEIWETDFFISLENKEAIKLINFLK